MNPNPVEPTERKLVRCNSCRATMPEGLFRCPHCGQITSGNERTVSEFALSQQMRARAAERAAERRDKVCSVCGKRIRKGTMCKDCNSKNSRNTLLLIVVGVVIVLSLLFYLFS